MAGLFSRLLTRKSADVQAPQEIAPRVPDGIRLYAVGDVHGRIDLLRVLMDRIAADFRKSGAARQVLVFVGDYVDRGLQSRQVVDFLLDDLPKSAQTHFLMGNHEEAFLQFMDDPAIGPRWKDFGGLETLHSYGIDISGNAPRDAQWFANARRELNQTIPPRHLTFFRELEMTVEYGDYYFVHAGVRPGVRLARQIAVDQLWIRDEFLSDRRDHGKIIVHGHTPAMQVECRPNRIGVDTGAYLTNNLSCLVLEGHTRAKLDTRTHADAAPLDA